MPLPRKIRHPDIFRLQRRIIHRGFLSVVCKHIKRQRIIKQKAGKFIQKIRLAKTKNYLEEIEQLSDDLWLLNQDLINGIKKDTEYFDDEGDVFKAPRDNYTDENVVKTVESAIVVVKEDMSDLFRKICRQL